MKRIVILIILTALLMLAASSSALAQTNEPPPTAEGSVVEPEATPEATPVPDVVTSPDVTVTLPESPALAFDQTTLRLLGGLALTALTILFGMMWKSQPVENVLKARQGLTIAGTVADYVTSLIPGRGDDAAITFLKKLMFEAADEAIKNRLANEPLTTAQASAALYGNAPAADDPFNKPVSKIPG